MKRTKLLSLTLAFALVLTTVFAGAESVFAEEESVLSKAKVTAFSNTVTAMQNTADLPGSDSNPVIAANLNSETDPGIYPISYSSSAPNEAVIKLPKAGVFVFNIQAPYGTLVALYDSPDPNAEPVAYQELSYTNQTLYFSAKKAGTYYLAFNTNSSSTITAKYSVAYAPAGDATLKYNKVYFASSTNSTKYYRYKVKTTKTGYLTIGFSYLDNDSTYTVRITNSKKKVISGATKVNYDKRFTTYAGLPKGTYYVEVKTKDPLYGIEVSAKYPSENSGTSKAKAKNLLKGGTKKGIITATQTSKSADWYKIKVNSNQQVILDVLTKTGGASGGIRVTTYSTKKSLGSADFYNGADPNSYSAPLELSNTINGASLGYLQKGTYYIKVTKYGKGNGYYEIKWR